MNKESKRYKTWPVNIPYEVVEDMKSRKLNITKAVRNSMQIAKLEPKYLYEVSCIKDNSIYYCMVDDVSETKVIKEMMRLDYFISGFKINGNGEYRIRLIGCFPDRSDLILYKELLINRALDKGLDVIDAYQFNRYISFKADIPVIRNLIRTNEDLSSLISLVVSILNKSDGNELIDKIHNSIDEVTKVIRKRTRTRNR